MPTVAVPERETQAAPAEPQVRWLRHRLAAGVASGLVLWTTFPPMEWGLLAWVALAPLFWLVTVRGAPARTYLAAWAGGLVFWILAVPWLRLIGPGAWIGWVVLGAVFSLWWPLFLALARWARFRLGVPLILAAPIAWVAVEYLRAYFLTGFPWYYLAHSQYRYLYVIQISDITGSLGVSLLIAMVNAWLVELVTIPLLRSAPGRPPRLTRGQSARLWAMTILVGRDPLLRRLPGLDGPVPTRAAGRAAAVEPQAGPQVRARSLRGPGGIPRADPPGHGPRAASRPDRLAGDVVSVRPFIPTAPGLDPATLAGAGRRDHRRQADGRRPGSTSRRRSSRTCTRWPRDLGVPMLVGSSVYGPPARPAPQVQLGPALPALPAGLRVLPQDAPGPVRRVHPADRPAAVAVGADARTATRSPTSTSAASRGSSRSARTGSRP